MGLSRLKAINASNGPINTLRSRRPDTRDATEVPLAKRQKQEALFKTYDATTSPFFSKPGPARSDAIEEVDDIEGHDSYDLRSTSSTENRASDGKSLHAFRNVQPDGSHKRTGRARRTSASRNSGAQRDSHGAQTRVLHIPPLASHSMGQRTTLTAPDSPDILSFDDPPPAVAGYDLGQRASLTAPDSPDILSFDDPPPADVSSDVIQLHSKTKRDRPLDLIDAAEPPVKRHKAPRSTEPIEDPSEDELQASSPNKAKWSRTASEEAFRLLAGMDERANFRSWTAIQPTCLCHPSRMALAQAVCGKKIYDRKDQGRVYLQQNQNNGARFEPRGDDGQIVNGLGWLGFELDQVHQFHHSATSCRIFVARSQSGDAGPKLHLKFESLQDAQELVGILRKKKFTRMISTKNMDELARKGDKAYLDAMIYAAQTLTARNLVSQNGIEGENDNPSASAFPLPLESSGTPLPLEHPRVGAPQNSNKPEKVKDRLLQSTGNEFQSDATTKPRPAVGLVPETRRSARTSSEFVRHRPSPGSWTDLNPDWQKSWQRSLVFPATGKNRATVDKCDIPRLNEGEYFNDNLINFYLRYLQATLEKERPELLNKVYFFSTFFFAKLRSTRSNINYEGVKAWTAKVDLFSYDYIVVPVNEKSHWYLAIICNAPNMIPGAEDQTTPTPQAHATIEEVDISSSQRMSIMERDMSGISLQDGAVTQTQTEEPAKDVVVDLCSDAPSPNKKRRFTADTPSKANLTQPKIITLDSLGSPHSPTCRVLKDYLIEEAKAKKGVDLVVTPTGMTAKGIPEQDNFCDCGIFVLGYMQEFLKKPDEAARKLLQRQDTGWTVQPSDLRSHMRTLLFSLQKEHQDRLVRREQPCQTPRKSAARGQRYAAPAPAPSGPLSSLLKLPGVLPPKTPERRPEADILSESSTGTLVGDVSDVELVEIRPHVDEVHQRACHENQETYQETEAKLISGLTDDSSTGPDTTGEIYHSAASSPFPRFERRGSKIVVELKAGNTSYERAFKAVPALGEVEMNFVRMLSSSSSESHGSHGRVEKHRQSSVEIIETEKPKPVSSSRLPPNRGVQRSNYISPFFQPMPSVEPTESKAPQGRPKYDGIDRTIDLTTS